MAAVDGSIRIDEQQINFILREEMLYDLLGDDSKQKFPKDRVLRLTLDTEKGVDLRGVLTYFDQTLLSAVGSCTDVTRWLRCSKCSLNNEVRYFDCKENFELSDDMERCVPLGKHGKEDVNCQHGSKRIEHSEKLNDADEIQSSIGSENLKLIKRWIREGKVEVRDIRAMALQMRGSVFGTYNQYERDENPVDLFDFMLKTWFNEKLSVPGVNGYQEMMNILNHEDVRLFALAHSCFQPESEC